MKEWKKPIVHKCIKYKRRCLKVGDKTFHYVVAEYGVGRRHTLDHHRHARPHTLKLVDQMKEEDREQS